jgi:hypothetical protein
LNKFLAAAAVGMAVFALQPGSARADTSAGPAEAAKAAELVRDINDLRTGNGLPALMVDDELTAKAAAWARTMGDAGRIWHSALPDGITADWAALGENVGTSGTVEQLHRAFVNSPHHYENLVRPDFQYVGVGIVDVDGVLYASEVFMKLQPAPPAASRPQGGTPAAVPDGSASVPPATPVAVPAVRVRTVRPTAAPHRAAPAPAVKVTAQSAVPSVDGSAHQTGGTVSAASGTPVTPALPPSSSGTTAVAAPETPAAPRLHLAGYATRQSAMAAGHNAASGVAVLIWAAVTAALVAMRTGRSITLGTGRSRLRRLERRRRMSDEDLRELLGIGPGPRPAT